jgi:hypothetical protein
MLGVTTFQIMKLFKRSRTLLQTVILIAIVITLANIVLMSLTETVINAQEVYFLEAIVISFAISIKRLQRQDLLETIRMSKKNYTFGVKGVGNDTSFLGPRIMSK